MKIIFAGGSQTVSFLSREAEEYFRCALTEGDVRFIVGDCYGVDRAVQLFLASLGADVLVYASEGKARNNPCRFPVVAIPAEGFHGRDYYRQKDIAMALEADEGVMIWDGKSKGTYANMLHLLGRKRPVTLFLQGQSKPIPIREKCILFSIRKESEEKQNETCRGAD